MPPSFAQMLERVGPVVAAVVIVLALLVVLPDDEDDEDDSASSGPAPTEAFLTAYERSRTVEVVVESVFTRTFPDGRELSYDQRLVQRPPDDRLVIGAGSASGRIDGRVVRCNAAPDAGAPNCVQGAEATPYDEEVAAEVGELARIVDPDEGAYDVTIDDDGCFELTLAVQILTPPYGLSSTFCFDDPSGALDRLDVVRPEATDHTEATAIRTEVTATDLRAGDLGEPVATG